MICSPTTLWRWMKRSFHIWTGWTEFPFRFDSILRATITPLKTFYDRPWKHARDVKEKKMEFNKKKIHADRTAAQWIRSADVISCIYAIPRSREQKCIARWVNWVSSRASDESCSKIESKVSQSQLMQNGEFDGKRTHAHTHRPTNLFASAFGNARLWPAQRARKIEVH